MRRYFNSLVQSAAIASLLWAMLPHGAFAATTEPVDLQADPAPCVGAMMANDDDRILAVCGPLIDNDKTLKPDRIKALIARAGVYDRKDQLERAIGDYDAVLRLDSALADIFNIRGELWRRKGDRPHALADFGAALKLNPQHEAARANYKSLALELERIGAQMAIKNKSNPPPAIPPSTNPALK